MQAQSVPNHAKKLLAEFAGTFFVVLIPLGITALLRNVSFDANSLAVLATALAYGAAYAGAVVWEGPFSGSHFNPAVVVARWVTHRLGTSAALQFIGAELVGAYAAAYVLSVALRILRLSLPQIDPTLLGPPALAVGVTRGTALLIEAAATFPLVLALWATIVGRARPRYWLGGIVAGIVVAAASYVSAPYTGGVLNPARAFGPALASGLWAYQIIYWTGPLAGGVAAAALYDLIFRRSAHSAEEVQQKTTV